MSDTNGNGKHGDIVVVIPRGEVIRNFVYTGALDEVAEDSGVSLLSVLPSDELTELLVKRYQKVLHLENYPERWIVRILREILEIAHGRWLWSNAAQERWRLRDVEADTTGKKLKRWTKKLACYPFANRTGLHLLSRAERATSRWFRTTDEFVRLFKELKPSLVFNGSHVHSSVAIQSIQAAQWLGIPTATFIFSWDNLTSQGRILPSYDYYLVWNEAIRDQLLDIYKEIRPEQIFITGTPQFDFHFQPEFYWTREKFCAQVGADPSRPIILYTTGMANHMPGEPSIVESIADLLRDMTDLGSPQLLVRVYPKDQTGRFEELKVRRTDILFSKTHWEKAWHTPRFEDCYMLTNSVRHADIGINVASTISLELCMFNKPVINVGYNPPEVDRGSIDYARYYEFDHYRPVVESGAVRVAGSEIEMHALLRSALAEPQKDSAERRKLIRQMFGNTLDGQASHRVAAQLVNLAQRPEWSLCQ